MPGESFQFKQFSINQDRCAMKVGTDGVLLGAWVNTDSCSRVLDIGTGTGLIALMLAQRSKAEIHAVEIDQEAALQAQENFNASLWKERIHLFPCSFQQFVNESGNYDLIVSNPPFFSQSLNTPYRERTLARHNTTLPLNDMMVGVKTLLKNSKGRFALIYPEDSMKALVEEAARNDLYLIRRADVLPSPGKPVKRVLAEFSGKKIDPEVDTLIVEEFGRHRYSEAYKKLTCDFYLRV